MILLIPLPDAGPVPLSQEEREILCNEDGKQSFHLVSEPLQAHGITAEWYTPSFQETSNRNDISSQEMNATEDTRVEHGIVETLESRNRKGGLRVNSSGRTRRSVRGWRRKHLHAVMYRVALLPMSFIIQ
jgi:hypothetical protein